ncbi:hypothetical protein AURDEDRAFT_123585 [Auricularia subglabra TFB-10046 SS5]|nr:hypothetical protein AURDEDRAFT_123585 [Auricularia subglabra TFB-10046 SS5]
MPPKRREKSTTRPKPAPAASKAKNAASGSIAADDQDNGNAPAKQTGTVGTGNAQRRRGRSGGQPEEVSNSEGTVTTTRKSRKPATATASEPDPPDVEQESQPGMPMEIDVDGERAEIPGNAPRPVTTTTTAPSNEPTSNITSSYAQWSATNTPRPPSGVLVADKTQSLKTPSKTLAVRSTRTWWTIYGGMELHMVLRMLFTMGDQHPRNPVPLPVGAPTFPAPVAPPQTPHPGPQDLNLASGCDAPQPKLGAFTPNSKRLLQEANPRVQARLFIINAFPDTTQSNDFAVAAWKDIMSREGQQYVRLSTEGKDWLVNQQYTLRTRYKVPIIAHVRALYSLSLLSGEDLKNRVDQLLDGDSFIYEVTAPRRPPKDQQASATNGTTDTSGDNSRVANSAGNQGGQGTSGNQANARGVNSSTVGSAGQSTATQAAGAAKFVELVGKSRAFTHPAILAVIAALGFERRSGSKSPQLTALLSDEFKDGIPLNLYAYACTTIHHALDCIIADTKFGATKYKGVYQYWRDTVDTLFNPSDARKKGKMDELRAQHWTTIRTRYHVQTVAPRSAAAARSRHDEALSTSDEED